MKIFLLRHNIKNRCFTSSPEQSRLSRFFLINSSVEREENFIHEQSVINNFPTKSSEIRRRKDSLRTEPLCALLGKWGETRRLNTKTNFRSRDLINTIPMRRPRDERRRALEVEFNDACHCEWDEVIWQWNKEEEEEKKNSESYPELSWAGGEVREVKKVLLSLSSLTCTLHWLLAFLWNMIVALKMNFGSAVCLKCFSEKRKQNQITSTQIPDAKSVRDYRRTSRKKNENVERAFRSRNSLTFFFY